MRRCHAAMKLRCRNRYRHPLLPRPRRSRPLPRQARLPNLPWPGQRRRQLRPRAAPPPAQRPSAARRPVRQGQPRQAHSVPPTSRLAPSRRLAPAPAQLRLPLPRSRRPPARRSLPRRRPWRQRQRQVIQAREARPMHRVTCLRSAWRSLNNRMGSAFLPAAQQRAQAQREKKRRRRHLRGPRTRPRGPQRRPPSQRPLSPTRPAKPSRRPANQWRLSLPAAVRQPRRRPPRQPVPHRPHPGRRPPVRRRPRQAACLRPLRRRSGRRRKPLSEAAPIQRSTAPSASASGWR